MSNTTRIQTDGLGASKTETTETNSYAKNKQNSVRYLLPLKRTLDQHTLRWLHVHEVHHEPSPSERRPRHVAKLRVEVPGSSSPCGLTAPMTQTVIVRLTGYDRSFCKIIGRSTIFGNTY